ncbi:MAG TPA: hypothetical protein ENK18_05660 [Deltaproteobacteria bacterium]|nr:hypothetical protein [Deltaproteobacteria bacterium]
MRSILALSILVGCARAPVEAPSEIGELGLFLFEHFEDPEPELIGAGWLNLAGFLQGVDYSLSADERALTMPPLDGPSLGGLSIPEGAQAADQVPVAISGESLYPLDDQLQLMTDPNQTCIESSSTVWAGRTFSTDVACFESGACERLETETEVRKDSFFAKVWYDQHKTYRRFEVEDSEGGVLELIAGRAWTDQVFEGDSGVNSWDQLFHLDVYLADGPRTLRWFSMWSSLSVAGLGDDAYSNLVVNGLEEALRFGDEYIAGVQTSCTHDRSAPRPERR